LMIASQQGHLETVDLLLSLGADVNFFDPSFRVSALIKACKEGHLQVVSRLISAGADVNLVSNMLKTAFFSGLDGRSFRHC
jgi:uncharacterized protein